MINIPRRVKNLIKKWGTRDPFKLCEYLGIVIIYSDLGVAKGYYEKILRKKVIVINENLDEFSMLIVLAHELGHALLHCSNDLQFLRSYTLLPRTSRLETEANKFAAELLLDDEMNFWGYEYNECGLGEKIFKDLIILKTNY